MGASGLGPSGREASGHSSYIDDLSNEGMLGSNLYLVPFTANVDNCPV
jgi:hypothetical protein